MFRNLTPPARCLFDFAAGNGVFLRGGRVAPGTMLTLYPGLIYDVVHFPDAGPALWREDGFEVQGVELDAALQRYSHLPPDSPLYRWVCAAFLVRIRWL